LNSFEFIYFNFFTAISQFHGIEATGLRLSPVYRFSYGWQKTRAGKKLKNHIKTQVFC